MKNLKLKFESIVNAYLTAFIKKHGYEFDGWISNDIGGIAGFIEQYFFNLDDIRYDIDNDCPKGKIFEWQDYCLEIHQYNDKHKTKKPIVNFKNWLLGVHLLPPPKKISKKMLKKEFDEKYSEALKEFKKYISFKFKK